MSFTVNDFHDLIQLLEQQPSWRAEVRRLVLTEELLALPEQLARFQAQTDRRFQELAETQKRTEEQIAELSVAMRRFGDDIGSVKGDLLEIRFDRRAPLYLSRLVRRMQVFSGEKLAALLDDAIEKGQLSEAEAADIARADTVGQGRRRADNVDVYIVVEVSWAIDEHDVKRAARRAALLAKTGLPAQPVVAGRRATSEATQQARELQVWQLTDGKIELAK